MIATYGKYFTFFKETGRLSDPKLFELRKYNVASVDPPLVATYGTLFPLAAQILLNALDLFRSGAFFYAVQ